MTEELMTIQESLHGELYGIWFLIGAARAVA